MSAISLKSITGITSITTPAGVDNQLTLHTNDTTERVKIDVAGNVHINNQLAVAGISTFTGNLFIPEYISHSGDIDSRFGFSGTDTFAIDTAGSERLEINSVGTGRFKGGAFLLTNGRLNVNYNIAHSSTYYLNNDAHILVENGDSSGTKKSVLKLANDAAIVYGGPGGTLIFSDRENERLRITSDGNVGINVTPASGHLLHIKDSSADAKLKIESESGYDARLILDTSNGSGAGAHIDFQIDGTVKGGIQYVSNASASDTHDIVFRNNSNTERLRIDSNGRILIGHDSTPHAVASVAVVGSYGGNSNLTPFVYLCRDEAATAISGGESLGQILFASKDGYRGAVIEANAAGAWSGSSSDASLVFKTTPDNATVPTERLRITQGGNVGINSTNPSTRLNVVGTIQAYASPTGFVSLTPTGSIELRRESGGFIDFSTAASEDYDCRIKQTSSNDLFFETGGSGSTAERLRIASDGNITFTGTTGNSSPRFTIKHNNADVEGEVIRFARTDLPTIRYHSIKAKHSGNSTNNYISFNIHDGGSSPYTSQAEVLRLRGDGKVGIGTDNPSSLLTLDHATNPSIQFKDSGTKVASINSEGTSTNIASFEGKDLLFACSASSAFTERLRIISSGEVSIGGFTPTAGAGILQINGGLRVAGSGSASDTTTPYIYRTSGVDNLNFATSGVERLRIQSNGNKVVQNGRLTINSTFIDFSGSISTPATAAAIYRPADNTLAFSTANNERIRLTNGGLDPSTDAVTDLGNSSKRYRDLYVSGGVVFDAVAGNATSNTLDDYEEGTFTPLMYGQITGGNSNTVSGNGYYTKVGDMCTMTVIFANKNGTGLPANEQMRISGIPFSFANGPGNQTSAVPFTYNVDFNTSHAYTFIGGNNISYLRGYNSRDSATWQPWMTASWRVSQFYLYVNMTYKTA